jgi:hypothetical protein
MSETFPIPFGRYQLVERLAVGGMAELFKARVVGAHGFQKPVVIKKILPHLAADPSFVAMFIDEAKITARLDHPKIAQVLELGTIEEQLYIAMEYVDGPDVLALLRACAHRKQVLPAHIAVHIAHEVLDALDYAHRARDDDGSPLGIVHRDISPSNVLISRRGDVKLADFGIAHAVERQQKTQAGTLKGKYGYMSPEQVVGGDLTGRSDLFSVAIVLAEMLMGRRLFTAPNDLDVLLMVRDVRLDRLDKYGGHIPASLREVMTRAFAREPKDRYATAGEFRDALSNWLFDQRVRVSPADLATLVDSLNATQHKTPLPGPLPQAPDAAAAAAGAKPAQRGTLAGPSTKARQIQAEEAARVGRAAAAQLKVAEGTPAAPAPPATPAASAPAGKGGAAGTGTQRAPTVPATPLAVALELGESDPAQGGVVALVSESGESGPVIVIEGLDDAHAVAASSRAASGGARRGVEPGAGDDDDVEAALARLGGGGGAAAPAAPASTPRGRTPGKSPPAAVAPAARGSQPAARAPQRAASTEDTSPSRSRPAAADSSGPKDLGEVDFSDVNIELDLVTPPGSRPRPSPEALESARRSPTLPPVPPKVGQVAEKPDLEGDFAVASPVHVLYKLAVEKASGLLVVEISAITKEIYLANGAPEFVSSNVARELLGEYLVAQKVISAGELAMALAMMPHFGGKLGDTLVGLGLMKPLDVFRHLTRQVRDKIVDVCTWQKGAYRWYKGKRSTREAFPLGLDAFEVLGAGASALPAPALEQWLGLNARRIVSAAKNPRVVPEAFRLGAYPRDVYNRLDGKRPLGDLVARHTDADERLTFIRTLYLLVQTELAILT